MLKSDRKLLELAAMAAGLVIDKSTRNGGGIGNTGFDAAGNVVLDWHNGTIWNPLNNDGDALRLSVKLGIFVGRGAARLEGFHYPDSEWITEGWKDDPMPATRRAIVRAAAAIGEDMQ